MKKEIERIAQHNDMSVEFVTWFFNEKKSACGEHWFLVLGAMWEGWKGRSIEMDRLAAENVALKAGVAEEIEVINRGGQMYCVKDGMSINPIYARGWNDHRANVTAVQTPATSAYLAGIKADGVEMFVEKCREKSKQAISSDIRDNWWLAGEHADDFAKQLREGDK